MCYRMMLVLLLVSCAPNYAEQFAGEWTVTTGTYRDTCPPPQLSGSRMHNPGDTTLSISASDNETLSVTLSFHSPSDPSSPSCDLVAIASSESTASLQARACAIASTRHDVLDGTLKSTPSGALILEYNAVIGTKDACQRTDSSTFVPK